MMAEFTYRALGYYMKGLSIEVRQNLFRHMNTEISKMMMKCFLEKDDGYPAFHSCGFSDDDIRLIGESYVEKFEYANRVMAEHGRAPLFSDPHDSYQSAKEHTELMKQRTADEIHEYFGCTYEEFVPVELKPSDCTTN